MHSILALDIGTRSVTGIILEKQNERFTLIDYYTKEHMHRSMRDGQIHNVVAVAEVIKDVKEALELTHGELTSVCVAAAGRALKTVQATAQIDLNQQPIVEMDTIKHLELSAVQAAQINLASHENNTDSINYYCVGYSVLHYVLDGETIGSLIDQNGQQATVEIIATFLPKVVVESLLAALVRADLEMEALTLEPIAAIHVLIPESMRRLNVALVDIGAGTSDIAITDKSTIVAYGMVPIAGDEITEAISDTYLLDFPKAEQTKRSIVNNGEDTVEDILGFDTQITYDTLVNDIASGVEKLANGITEKIIQLNSKSPKAVMLVGGGSLTPGITQALATKLQLPANRVAVRGIDAIPNITKADNLPLGPDYVTPIGIAIAAKQNPVHYVSVDVNNRTIRMFEMKQLTVGDCFIQAGIEINKWYGKPGIASIVTVNGKEITLPGEYGNAPLIQLNDSPSSVDSYVANGDKITIKKGQDGKNPHVSLAELIGETSALTIYYNSVAYPLKTTFYVNKERKEKDYILNDKDQVVLHQPRTVQDFIETLRSEERYAISPFYVFVNGQKVMMKSNETQLFVNHKQANLNQVLKDGDKLLMQATHTPTIESLLEQLDLPDRDSIKITFNDQPIVLEQQLTHVYKNQQELTKDSSLKLGDKLEITQQDITPYIFQDVFRYVDIDLSLATGGFKLYKNQQPTTFHETIKHGDDLAIDWKTS
ncbi:cell division protein FtsA [Virgibacillus sp. FSP13]